MIRAIVEGYGDEGAVPVLLRRLLPELGIYDIPVLPSVRIPRTRLVTPAGMQEAIRTARRRPHVSAILAVFDLEGDCARDIVPALLACGEREAQPLPFAMALARREYEAWFLAALSSLAGRRHIRSDAAAPPNPEAIRGPKGRIGSLMVGTHYVERTDQPALSALIDLQQAYRGASSFRKLVKELCRLLEALGRTPQIPANWISP